MKKSASTYSNPRSSVSDDVMAKQSLRFSVMRSLTHSFCEPGEQLQKRMKKHYPSPGALLSNASCWSEILRIHNGANAILQCVAGRWLRIAHLSLRCATLAHYRWIGHVLHEDADAVVHVEQALEPPLRAMNALNMRCKLRLPHASHVSDFSRSSFSATEHSRMVIAPQSLQLYSYVTASHSP